MSSLEKELELLHIRRAKVEGCMKEADAVRMNTFSIHGHFHNIFVLNTSTGQSAELMQRVVFLQRHEEAVRKHKEKMSKWQSTLAGLHQRELEITRDLVRPPSCSSTIL